jgi:hypothetical protein
MRVTGLAFLILVTDNWGPLVMAQMPGTFTATGSMRSPRESHTATLLPNGKVLIAGGEVAGVPDDVLASAELYDPYWGTFAVVGNMSVARVVHTATLLGDGRVLIAGGLGGFGALASAELYDPSTGMFTATGTMAVRRAQQTATLLNDGRVLIAGGHNDTDGPLAGAELYDPSTGAFTNAGMMTIPRSGSVATLLSDGKVLIQGGQTTGYTLVLGGEIYDPSAGTFSPTGGNTYGVLLESTGSASPLMNGKVLFILHTGEDTSDKAAEYDPCAGAFTATGNMTALRYFSTATLLSDGRVLIAGLNYDSRGDGLAISHADLYDPAPGTFSATGNMLAPRTDHTATLLTDGTVLLAGGAAWFPGNPSRPFIDINTAEIYHPETSVPAPTLLSLSGDGNGRGAIQHAATYQLVSADNPAVAGEILAVYCTGLVAGNMIPPRVVIGGRMAEVVWFGNTPGYTGLNQINVRVPGGVAAGPAVPIRLTYIGRPSNEVTIGVR